LNGQQLSSVVDVVSVCKEYVVSNEWWAKATH
jgi:hypothetical protein